jgi:hypothetical protein
LLALTRRQSAIRHVSTLLMAVAILMYFTLPEANHRVSWAWWSQISAVLVPFAGVVIVSRLPLFHRRPLLLLAVGPPVWLAIAVLGLFISVETSRHRSARFTPSSQALRRPAGSRRLVIESANTLGSATANSER